MIITVKNKNHKVPASLVIKVQNMTEHGKTDMEIAQAIGRPRQYVHAVKIRVLEEAQMMKVAV